MPKSRKFRKNSIDFKYGFEPGLIEQALIKAKRDLPYTELAKVLPKPKTMLYYYQKNHGKHREPSIVIFNQKIQGRSKKMGGVKRSTLSKHKKTMKRRVKKTRRNRSNKYKKGMMGGDDTDPSTPRGPDNNVQILQQKLVKAPNTNPVAVQGVATNLAPVFAQEPTRAQTGARDLSDQY
jgi:hypothetical protein